MRQYLLFIFACILAFKNTVDCPMAICQELRGLQTSSSSDNQADNTSEVSTAPGADAMMTPDLLLVTPTKTGSTPEPLQTFVGKDLILTIEHDQLSCHGLHGLKIKVVNNTHRPLFIDGDNAKAILGNKTYSVAPVAALQNKVMPSSNIATDTRKFVTNVTPSFLTVGATSTLKDYRTIKKPIRERYGPDEERRLAELSRFGKRILWPHQNTAGILYFQTGDIISGAKVQIPVHTLFDTADSAMLQ